MHSVAFMSYRTECNFKRENHVHDSLVSHYESEL